MKRFFLFFLLLPFLMKCSCHRKEKVYPTYYMDQEFKDYCHFKVGSYWVYQDSATGNLDSMSLYNQINKISGYKTLGYDYEWFSQRISSSYFQDTLYGIGGAFELPLSNSCRYMETFVSNPFATNNTFFSNKDTGAIYESNQNIKIQYINYYDSIAFSTVWFKKVKVFKNLQQEGSNLPQRIYHARNIGVIRRELFNGQVWNLIKYHIN